jgi:hypothetical protein
LLELIILAAFSASWSSSASCSDLTVDFSLYINTRIGVCSTVTLIVGACPTIEKVITILAIHDVITSAAKHGVITSAALHKLEENIKVNA